jgi:hypothetical protein
LPKATASLLTSTSKDFSVRQGKPDASSGCNSRPGKGMSRPTGDRALGSWR